jgi:hypothetical protein
MAHDTYLRFVLVPTMDDEPHPNRLGEFRYGDCFFGVFFQSGTRSAFSFLILHPIHC